METFELYMPCAPENHVRGVWERHGGSMTLWEPYNHKGDSMQAPLYLVACIIAYQRIRLIILRESVGTHARTLSP